MKILNILSYYDAPSNNNANNNNSNDNNNNNNNCNNTHVTAFTDMIIEVIITSLQSCVTDPHSSGASAGAIVGLLCHFLLSFSSVTELYKINLMLHHVLLCLNNSGSSYVRYSMIMGLVHMFARNASLLANPSSPLLGVMPVMPSPPTPPTSSSLSSSFSSSLSLLPIPPSQPTQPSTQPTQVSALKFILDLWCTLHVHLTARYSSAISTLGLIELIKIFSRHSVNYSYALQVLQLSLSTLPRILLHSSG